MITIGADPELFVRKGFHFISGHTIPCGYKFAPVKTEHGAIQNDGTAVEFNVKPSSTRQEFVRNVQGAISDLELHVKKTDPLFSVVARPSVFFGIKYLADLPLEARDLGCNADFDAHGLEENEKPDVEAPFRTGAGHIHIGWTKDAEEHDPQHMFKCARIVRELDFYLGLPSLGWDRDSRRRLLYGKAGAFRPKSYGLEYRVLSNVWVNNSELIGRVFDQTVKAFEATEQGHFLHSRYGDFARDAINNDTYDWEDLAPEIAEEIA